MWATLAATMQPVTLWRGTAMARAFHSAPVVSAIQVLTKKNKPKEKPKERNRVDKDTVCLAHIRATFNNTFITITRPNGDAMVVMSTGRIGYKKSKRKTPFAAQQAAQEAAQKAYSEWGVRSVDVRINGIGPGRNSVVRGLMTGGLRVQAISDVTGVPHNGCRPPKQRRI